MEQKQKLDKNELNKKLEVAANKLDLDEIKSLMEQGASAKAVNSTGGGDWYGGDTSSALFKAVEARPKEGEDMSEFEIKWCTVLNFLLLAGADANFKREWGSWAGSSRESVANKLFPKLANMKDHKLRQELFKNLVASGFEVNTSTRNGKQKNYYGYGEERYPVFRLIGQIGDKKDTTDQQKKNDEDFLKTVIECGVNVKAAEWYWGMQFASGYDDEDNDGKGTTYSKSYRTIIQQAIKNNLLEVTKFLIEKGADVNAPHVYYHTPQYTEFVKHSDEQIEDIKRSVEESKENIQEWQKKIEEL